MEITRSSEKPNSQSVKEESQKPNEDKYFLRDSDGQCLQGTSSLNNSILEESSVNNCGDLPQVEALPSLVPKRKRKRARETSALINDDSDPDCIERVPPVDNFSAEKISSVLPLGRNVHHESPHGTDTLPEEPVNIISDLVPVPPHADLSRRKRKGKKAKISAAAESDSPFLESCAGICTAPNSEKANEHSDFLPLQRQKKKKQNKDREVPENNDRICESPRTNVEPSCSQRKMKNKKKLRQAPESSYKSCDLSVGTSVENIILTVGQSLQPSVSEVSKQELEVVVAQPPLEGISTLPKSECSEPIADLSCSRKKKKRKQKRRSETQESNDGSCGNDKKCDISVCTSPGLDLCLQPSVSEFSERKLELPQPLTGVISVKTNSESSEPIADLSCSRKKKKRKQKRRSETQESNDGSCGIDKKCDISVCTSPGLDLCLQPSVSEFSEQKLELPEPLTGVISTKTNSESSEPFANLSSPRKSKKQKRKKKSKTLESNDENCGSDNKCGPSFSTFVENILPGTDASQQLPVSGFSKQKLELSQPLTEGISTEVSSECPKPNTDVSCSRENQKKKTKRKYKIFERNDERCDLSVGTSSGNIMPGVDLWVQPPVEVLSEQEQPLMEGISREASSEGPKPSPDVSCSQENRKKKTSKRHKTLNHVDLNESSILEEKNGLQSIADGGSRSKIETEINCASQEWVNMKTYMRKGKDEIDLENVHQSCNPVLDLDCFKANGVNGTSSHCSDAFPEAKVITDTERTGTKIEVSSLLPLSVKADVGVAVSVKEGEDLSQISDSAVERSIVTPSKKKLLILDVNGLLADIVQRESFIPNRYEPDAIISKKAVFKRPFCDDFLQFCFNKFNVGVWSSRTKKNVDLVMNFLLGNSKCKLIFCWNQSHCTTTRFRTLGNENKPIVLKELKKLWEKADPDLPWVRGEYDESNTLLLDDSPYKALSNPPDTAIFPYSYQYRDTRDTSLGPGGDIRAYLEGIAAADNVKEYVRQHPFGQRPITEKHLRWDFYSKIVGDLKRESKR